MIDLQSFLGRGEAMTKHTCSGPALAGVQESAGNVQMHICVLAIPLFLDQSS